MISCLDLEGNMAEGYVCVLTFVVGWRGGLTLDFPRPSGDAILQPEWVVGF
jgi:hypothetical protein